MKKILLIQTGGTIAMDINDENDTPELDPEAWHKLLIREIPELRTIAQIDIELLYFQDSSDIHAEHWTGLIRYIHRHYDSYHGFVILHGTDTMAYTASALSFGLQGLGKPVILTGSQVPMSNIRSDARRNLVNAIEMATLPVPEVAICFNDYLYRGNRSTKMSIGDFDAFATPNHPPLAEIGLNIELGEHLPMPNSPLEIHEGFDDRIFLLKAFPNLRPDLLNGLDLSGIRALVVEAFGSGNFPAHGEKSLAPFLRQCIERDIFLVISSQAPYDAVDLPSYESGKIAEQMGALSAGDMTTEAALTKMMYLLDAENSRERIIESFRTNLAGELTA